MVKEPEVEGTELQGPSALTATCMVELSPVIRPMWPPRLASASLVMCCCTVTPVGAAGRAAGVTGSLTAVKLFSSSVTTQRMALPASASVRV